MHCNHALFLYFLRLGWRASRSGNKSCRSLQMRKAECGIQNCRRRAAWRVVPDCRRNKRRGCRGGKRDGRIEERGSPDPQRPRPAGCVGIYQRRWKFWTGCGSESRAPATWIVRRISLPCAEIKTAVASGQSAFGRSHPITFRGFRGWLIFSRARRVCFPRRAA